MRIVIALTHTLEHCGGGQPAGALEAGHLERRAVELDDVGGAGFLMQAVDVLRDHDGRSPALLEASHRPMRSIGLRCFDTRLEAVPPALSPNLRVRHVVLDRVAVGIASAPQSLGAAEVGDSRLGGDSGAGEHEDVARRAQPAKGQFGLGACHRRRHPTVAAARDNRRR